jgi:hypothetical protein
MKTKRAAVSVFCTTSFSVCSRRRTKMPIIIYPDLRLDYKVATHPFSWCGRLDVLSFKLCGELSNCGRVRLRF